MIRRLLASASALFCGALLLSACSPSPSATETQFSKSRSAHLPADATLEAGTHPSGILRSLGGPYLSDAQGRTVYLRGVNAVYKRDPYTLTIKPGLPNSMTEYDAQQIAANGFNVVRLGVIWAGIEPGSGGPNQPAVCTKGTPGDPHMWNQQVAAAYLDQVEQVVNLLGKYHIYSLIDMHQDVYSSVFSGEGAPAWAVCTDGNPVVIYPGRWSNNYSNPAVDSSFQNFFFNQVTGNLQGEYQRSWKAVATRFATNDWVVGYDPINEPLSLQAYKGTDNLLYAQGLSCLYGGSGGQTWQINSKAIVPCPSSVPKQGLVDLLLRTDTNHLIFPEIDNASDQGKTMYVTRAQDVERIVYNFHDYCPQRSGVTGNPTDLQVCSDTELQSMIGQSQKRPLYRTQAQPGGPAIMMTEFGATDDETLASMLVQDAATLGLSWSWWSWRYYDDPTGSSAEAILSTPGNVYSPVIKPLSSTKVLAVSGTVLAAQPDDRNGMFTMTYVSGPSVQPTSIWISPRLYQTTGYCAYVAGGHITSKPGSAYLTVTNNDNGIPVTIRVEPGNCVPGL